MINRKGAKKNTLPAPIGKYDRSLYLLQKVMEDYHSKGLDMLIRESRYKAAVLYQMIEDSPYLRPSVDKSQRSSTMIIAEGERSFLQKIELLGYELGKVQHSNSAAMVIANYSTHSKELIEMFADRVLAL